MAKIGNESEPVYTAGENAVYAGSDMSAPWCWYEEEPDEADCN